MSLFGSIQSAAGALSVFGQAINTIQTNVANASVDNYTAQSPSIATSLTGIVFQGSTDARSQFAEQSVWDSNQNLGQATAQADNLSIVQSQFDVSGQAGVPGSLSTIFKAFSAWAQTPTDSTARNQVLAAASQVASAFNEAASTLEQSQVQVDSQLSSSVAQINSIEGRVVQINTDILNHGGSDPTLQAQLYGQLQQLSQFTTIAVHIETNGTATVLMNGQVPLVVGSTASEVKVQDTPASAPPNPSAPHTQQITVAGRDVTGIITGANGAGGKLAGLLAVRNQTLPSLLGDQNQQGTLNNLAKTFADRVNTLLASGQDSNGNPGAPLFTYNSSLATSTASSLQVSASITADQLAAVSPASGSTPAVANGVANQLAGLSSSTDPLDRVNGYTYTDYYSKLTADLGAAASAAQTSKTSYTDQFTQAENLRSQTSGISLDEQAALLQQYQQAYQATSQLISVLNTTTGYLMDILNR